MIVLGTVAAAVDLLAAVSLFDFSTAEGRADVSRISRTDYRSGTVDFLGAVGTGYSAFLWARPWSEGDYEYPSLYLTVSSVHDWTRYDRLVIDMANQADFGDIVTLSVQDPVCGSNGALLRSTPLPAWGFKRWVVTLDYWPETIASNNITKLQIYSYRPQALNAFFSRFTLLEPGEELPPETEYAADDVAAVEAGAAAHAAEVAAKRAAFLGRLARDNAAAGLETDAFLLGKAASTDGVRPKDTFAADAPRHLSLRLARGECEALQLLVTPNGEDLADVRVTAAEVPGCTLSVAPVGYVEINDRPNYQVGYDVPSDGAPGYARRTRRVELGWWPDPILSYADAVDVAEGDVQSFWVRAEAARDAKAGLYGTTLTVTARRGTERIVRTLPLAVRVNGFEIPSTPPTPIVVSFSPSVYVRPDQNGPRDRDFAARMAEKPDSPLNMWQERRMDWADFLADHFITMQKLYQHADADICYDVYDRLLEQGRMGGYNLFYFSSQKVSASWETWMGWVESEIARRLDKAAARGLGDHCFVYCCDETPVSRFDEVEPIMRRLRTKFPSLRILSTCQDRSYGLDSGLGDITGFIPTTDRYDPAQAALSRAAGHEVWWYYACDEKAPYPNVFTECQPIEQRLLMGAMAAKYRPDGFLYYQMTYFNSENCITGGPYTDWNPRSWYREHGDATWVAVGPGGMPLSTIRFENFRDGVEDLWYAELLRAKLAEKPDAAWAGRARALLEVPRSVVDSLTNYTDRAESLLAWRDGIADLLEGGSYTIHGGDVTTLTNVLAIGETWKTYRLEPGVFDLAPLTNAPMSLSPTWWGPSLLSVPNGSTFVGTGDGPEEVVLKGPGVHRLMCVSGNCTIRNLTFEGGNALTGGANAKYCSGGALVTSGSAPTVSNCVFRGNCAKYGGAVNGITAWDCLFTGNWTEGYGFGGAGYLGRYYGCTIVSNAATDVWANGGGLSGATVVDGCTVVSNVAAYGGGGLGECRGVVNTLVAFNAAVGPNNARGGGLYSCGTITNCTVACNLASGYAHGMVDTSAVGSSFRFNGSSHHSRNSSGYVARFEDCDLVGSAVESASLERCRVHHVSNAVAVADNVHYGPSVRTLIYPFENCTHLRNVLIDGCWITNWSNHACFYTSGRSLSVENCTIVSNSFTYTVRGYGGDRTADFVNTVFCGNRRGSEEVDFRGYESPNVNFVDSIVGLVRPRFVGTEPHPYSPQRRSPLVGRGAVADWMRTAADLAGNPMLKSEDATSVDVGCYQCWLEAPGALLFIR